MTHVEIVGTEMEGDSLVWVVKRPERPAVNLVPYSRTGNASEPTSIRTGSVHSPSRRVAYIAGPYRAPTPFQIQRNIRVAAETALKYWKLGYAVICPHMNTAMFDGEAPDEVWLQGDQELLKRSDVVVMVGEWRESKGAMSEFKLAKALKKEIIIERINQFMEELEANERRRNAGV